MDCLCVKPNRTEQYIIITYSVIVDWVGVSLTLPNPGYVKSQSTGLHQPMDWLGEKTTLTEQYIIIAV